MNERTSGADMRHPGEAFCVDCPDREACATGYPCNVVRATATATDASTEREAEAEDEDVTRMVAAVLAAHGPSGFVSSRDGWIECDCGDRLPCTLDSDGNGLDPDAESALWAVHRAEALAPLIAEQRRAAVRECSKTAPDSTSAQREDPPPGTPEFLGELDRAADDWDRQPEWMKPLRGFPYLASRRLDQPGDREDGDDRG